MVGPVDAGNPASVTPATLVEWEQQGWIRHLGERSDIRELLAISDVVVLPSYREGFPRVLLEAAAMARAIVTTDVPGCRDVVDDGENGLLAPVRDAGALALAVEKLLASPSLRERFGDAARRKAVAEFDERRVVERMMRLYDELLAGKPRA
jgi:glycosyltransferase involved in cell wall biosynthesis